ncbi:hypothetical protein Tco_1227553, partial [Tanacetum coccineum]
RTKVVAVRGSGWQWRRLEEDGGFREHSTIAITSSIRSITNVADLLMAAWMYDLETACLFTFSACCIFIVCLVSATLPNEILEMTSKFMTDRVRILVKRDELILEVLMIIGGKCYISLSQDAKDDQFGALLEELSSWLLLTTYGKEVFCNIVCTKKTTQQADYRSGVKTISSSGKDGSSMGHS